METSIVFKLTLFVEAIEKSKLSYSNEFMHNKYLSVFIKKN